MSGGHSYWGRLRNASVGDSRANVPACTMGNLEYWKSYRQNFQPTVNISNNIIIVISLWKVYFPLEKFYLHSIMHIKHGNMLY